MMKKKMKIKKNRRGRKRRRKKRRRIRRKKIKQPFQEHCRLITATSEVNNSVRFSKKCSFSYPD